MIRYIFCFTVCLISCKSSKQVAETPAIEFEDKISFTSLLDQAKEENKMVFLDFYTDWCLPCKMMEEEVFTDENLSNYFNQQFINMKIDAEKGEGPDLSVIYQVNKFPTLIFVDYRGRVILRKEGMAYHTELQRFAEHAISKWQNQ